MYLENSQSLYNGLISDNFIFINSFLSIPIQLKAKRMLTYNKVKTFHKSCILVDDCSDDPYPAFNDINDKLYVKENNESFFCLHSKMRYEIGDYICNIHNEYYPTKIRDPHIDTTKFMSIFKHVNTNIEMENDLQKEFNAYYNQNINNINIVCAKDPILYQTCYKSTRNIYPDDELLRYKGFVYGLKYIASNGLLTKSNITGFIKFVENNFDSLTIDFYDKAYITKFLDVCSKKVLPFQKSEDNLSQQSKIYLMEIENCDIDIIYR